MYTFMTIVFRTMKNVDGYRKKRISHLMEFFCTKVGRQLNVLQRMRGSFDYVSRMAIYNSLIFFLLKFLPYCLIAHQ